MCWYTKDISRTTPLVSDGKVSVIKLVTRNEDGSFSPIFHPEFRCEIGKVANCDKSLRVRECKGVIIKYKSTPEYCPEYRITQGLHSYIKGEVELYSFWKHFKIRLLFIQTKKCPNEKDENHVMAYCYLDPKLIVMECTIPENMRYYVNRNGEVVSKKLIPIKTTMVEEYIHEQNINKQ